MYQVNFSSWRAARQLSRYRFWRNIGLCKGIFFAITLVAMQMQSHSRQISQQGSLKALLQQQTVLSQQHQQVQQLMAQKQRAEQRAQMYQSAHRYSVLLQQLSQQIPDNCWLISLTPQSDKLVFEAVSQDYAAIHHFLAQLGRQPLLANVRLQRISQRDDGHFRFMAQVDWPQEGISDE